MKTIDYSQPYNPEFPMTEQEYLLRRKYNGWKWDRDGWLRWLLEHDGQTVSTSEIQEAFESFKGKDEWDWYVANTLIFIDVLELVNGYDDVYQINCQRDNTVYGSDWRRLQKEGQ